MTAYIQAVTEDMDMFIQNMVSCQCPACQHYSRAYIRHLLKAKEMLGMRLCVLHNLYFYNHMMEEIRDALDAGNFAEYKKMRLEGFEEGKINSKR